MGAVPLDVCRIVNRTVCLIYPDFLCLFFTSMVPFLSFWLLLLYCTPEAMYHMKICVNAADLVRQLWATLWKWHSCLVVLFFFSLSKIHYGLLQHLVNSPLLLNLTEYGLLCLKVDRYGFFKGRRYLWPTLKAQFLNFLGKILSVMLLNLY